MAQDRFFGARPITSVDLFHIPVRYLFSKNKDEKTAEEKLGDEAKEKIKDTSRDILKEMDVNLYGKISKEEFMK